MGKKYSAPEATAVVRIAHEPPRYTVHTGWGYLQVHCPRCLSVADGWTKLGNPRYSGGVLYAEEPIPGADSMHAIAVACDCLAGRAAEERLGLQRFDQLAPAAVVHEAQFPVAWDRQVSERPACDLPDAAPEDLVQAFAQACGRQLARFQRGKISLEQLAANLRALTERNRPALVEDRRAGMTGNLFAGEGGDA